MTRKIIIIGAVLLLIAASFLLFDSTTIDADLVKKEFKMRMPDCELISLVDVGDKNHENWEVTFKNAKGEINTMFWQVRDAGLFSKDIQVVVGG